MLSILERVYSERERAGMVVFENRKAIEVLETEKRKNPEEPGILVILTDGKANFDTGEGKVSKQRSILQKSRRLKYIRQSAHADISIIFTCFIIKNFMAMVKNS